MRPIPLSEEFSMFLMKEVNRLYPVASKERDAFVCGMLKGQKFASPAEEPPPAPEEDEWHERRCTGT